MCMVHETGVHVRKYINQRVPVLDHCASSVVFSFVLIRLATADRFSRCLIQFGKSYKVTVIRGIPRSLLLRTEWESLRSLNRDGDTAATVQYMRVCVYVTTLQRRVVFIMIYVNFKVFTQSAGLVYLIWVRVDLIGLGVTSRPILNSRRAQTCCWYSQL